jgi:hypothetical protein
VSSKRIDSEAILADDECVLIDVLRGIIGINGRDKRARKIGEHPSPILLRDRNPGHIRRNIARGLSSPGFEDVHR